MPRWTAGRARTAREPALEMRERRERLRPGARTAGSSRRRPCRRSNSGRRGRRDPSAAHSSRRTAGRARCRSARAHRAAVSRRVAAEVVGLAGLRAEVGHLPEQPLVDLRRGRARSRRIELAGLAAEVLQDRAGLEHRDRPPARPVGIDDRGDAVVRRDFQERRLELLAARDVRPGSRGTAGRTLPA